jgi:hypothetical protein
VAASILLESPRQLGAALAGLQAAALRILTRESLPHLYQSGVRYRRERPMQEHWKLPDQTYRDGFGDCEDLASWRAAELQKAGEDANIVLVRAKPKLWHVAVQREDGSLEDPSKRLGMRGPA